VQHRVVINQYENVLLLGPGGSCFAPPP